jgi:hypothetical protein
MWHAYDGGGEGVRRRVWNITATLSLLLCLGTATLWARSYWMMDVIRRWDAGRRTEQILISDAGTLRFTANRYAGDALPSLPPGSGRRHYSFPARTGMLRDRDQFLGFGFRYGAGVAPDYGIGITLPYWFLTCLTGLAVMMWIFHWLTRREERLMGVCRHCGYDLRATRDRCPECGTVPGKPERSADRPSPATNRIRRSPSPPGHAGIIPRRIIGASPRLAST